MLGWVVDCGDGLAFDGGSFIFHTSKLWGLLRDLGCILRHSAVDLTKGHILVAHHLRHGFKLNLILHQLLEVLVRKFLFVGKTDVAKVNLVSLVGLLLYFALASCDLKIHDATLLR